MTLFFEALYISGWIANTAVVVVNLLLYFIYDHIYESSKLKKVSELFLLNAILFLFVSIMPILLLAGEQNIKTILEISMTIYSFYFIWRALQIIKNL